MFLSLVMRTEDVQPRRLGVFCLASLLLRSVVTNAGTAYLESEMLPPKGKRL